MHGTGTFFDRHRSIPDSGGERLGKYESDARPEHLEAGGAARQIAIPAPKAPEGSFDKAAAARGKTPFNEKAQCAICHVGRSYRAGAQPAHAGGEGPSIRSRRALADPQVPHRPATLKDVLAHYDRNFKLGLSDREKAELIEYLKSL